MKNMKNILITALFFMAFLAMAVPAEAGWYGYNYSGYNNYYNRAYVEGYDYDYAYYNGRYNRNNRAYVDGYDYDYAYYLGRQNRNSNRVYVSGYNYDSLYNNYYNDDYRYGYGW